MADAPFLPVTLTIRYTRLTCHSHKHAHCFPSKTILARTGTHTCMEAFFIYSDHVTAMPMHHHHQKAGYSWKVAITCWESSDSSIQAYHNLILCATCHRNRSRFILAYARDCIRLYLHSCLGMHANARRHDKDQSKTKSLSTIPVNGLALIGHTVEGALMCANYPAPSSSTLLLWETPRICWKSGDSSKQENHKTVPCSAYHSSHQSRVNPVYPCNRACSYLHSCLAC